MKRKSMAEKELERQNRGMDIPDFAIERIARCLLPMIQSYYESDEGRRDMAEWELQQKTEQV
ncbi:MAG: hypothetical protein IJT62_03525 [Oscillospiraceae bacterium]|nr:hypothetical protein [Oscillospiraceae bacterium]